MVVPPTMSITLWVYYFSDEGEFRNSRFAAQPVGGHTASNYDNETEAWQCSGRLQSARRCSRTNWP